LPSTPAASEPPPASFPFDDTVILPVESGYIITIIHVPTGTFPYSDSTTTAVDGVLASLNLNDSVDFSGSMSYRVSDDDPYGIADAVRSEGYFGHGVDDDVNLVTLEAFGKRRSNAPQGTFKVATFVGVGVGGNRRTRLRAARVALLIQCVYDEQHYAAVNYTLPVDADVPADFEEFYRILIPKYTMATERALEAHDEERQPLTPEPVASAPAPGSARSSSR
jgi:hypothetical protein